MSKKVSPNLVFVFPDEWRAQSLGFLGQDPVITPNLDRFASESKVLTQAVSNFPVCSPFRAMLMTGMYPYSNSVIGNEYNGVHHLGYELRESDRTITDILSDNGYNVGYLGKWHLDLPKEEDLPYTEGWRGDPENGGTYWDSYTPPGQRRHSIDFWHSYGCCDQHLTPHYWEGDASVDERIDVEGWSVEHETDIAVNYIKNVGGKFRDEEKPFALFVAHNPPHMPFDEVPERYKALYADKSADELLNRPNAKKEGIGTNAWADVNNYFAAISGIDDQFGRILHAIDEVGHKEDTIVVFTSDHGEMMGSQGMMHKVVWYDESLLIPFIIRYPEVIEPGEDDLLIGVPDLMPTLLQLMGIEELPEKVEGSDYSLVLTGDEGEKPTSAFYIVPNLDNPKFGNRGLRTDDYTFVIQRSEKGETVHLYNLSEDPYQQKECAEIEPEIVARLRMELNDWLQKTNDPWDQVTG